MYAEVYVEDFIAANKSLSTKEEERHVCWTDYTSIDSFEGMILAMTEDECAKLFGAVKRYAI